MGNDNPPVLQRKEKKLKAFRCVHYCFILESTDQLNCSRFLILLIKKKLQLEVRKQCCFHSHWQILSLSYLEKMVRMDISVLVLNRQTNKIALSVSLWLGKSGVKKMKEAVLSLQSSTNAEAELWWKHDKITAFVQISYRQANQSAHNVSGRLDQLVSKNEGSSAFFTFVHKYWGWVMLKTWKDWVLSSKFQINRRNKSPTPSQAASSSWLQKKMKEAVPFSHSFTNAEAGLCWKTDKTEYFRPTFKSIDQTNGPHRLVLVRKKKSAGGVNKAVICTFIHICCKEALKLRVE